MQIYLADMKDMKAKEITKLTNYPHPCCISADNLLILFVTPKGFNYSNTGIYHRSNLWSINRYGSGLINFKLNFSAVRGQKPPLVPTAEPATKTTGE